MDNILHLKFLQFKKQPFLHLFPIVFLYTFVLPYLNNTMTRTDAISVLRTFYLIEGLVLVFAIWYQFLDFQMIFYKDLKEISFVNFTMPHYMWFVFSKAAYICFLMPFLVIFQNASSLNKNSTFIFILQICELSLIIYLITQFLHSSLAGTICGILYLFICTSEYLPSPWNMAVIGTIPSNVTLKWFLFHGSIVLILSIHYFLSAVSKP